MDPGCVGVAEMELSAVMSRGEGLGVVQEARERCRTLLHAVAMSIGSGVVMEEAGR